MERSEDGCGETGSEPVAVVQIGDTENLNSNVEIIRWVRDS